MKLLTQLLLLPLAVAAGQTASFEHQCASLASSLNIKNTTTWFTQYVSAGTNITFPDNVPDCARPSQVASVDLCRVALLITTSIRSNVSAEAWLPRHWAGRYSTIGNGGLSGCIQYEDLAYNSALGFATLGTNAGHNGTRGTAFYHNDDILADFVYRSVQVGTQVGKAVTKAFYGQAQDRSYYFGCSTGGRQGFKEAQDFSGDFDGWLVGAPAIDFNNLQSWSGSFLADTGYANSSSFIPPNLWDVIHNDINNQCDGLDGVLDGIIEDPNLCQYRPEALLCGSANNNTSACLTGAQAETVRKVFSPIYYPDGTLAYPRMQPGSETVAKFILYNGQPFPFTQDWMAYVVYKDPSWQPTPAFNNRDYAAATAKNPFNAATFNPDLSGVRNKGAKILHYHGLADFLISSDNSERYYDMVSRNMSLPSSELDHFYRYFRISGMGHCSGGAGASYIGQTLASNVTNDPSGNVLMALVKWVEEGVAPETIEGTAFVDQTAASGQVAFKRKHCRYPYRNTYIGGNSTLPESWECRPVQ